MNDILERYYTKDIVSTMMMSLIPCSDPKVILDLGVGEASLTRAAFCKWNNASFYGIDVDFDKIQKNIISFPFCKFIHTDTLKSNFINTLAKRIGIVDIAICNPPYSKTDDFNYDLFEHHIENAKLSSLKKIKKLSTELIFLVHNLSILKDGGYLGIILPDGIFTNHNYKHLRRDLLEKNEVSYIIELNDKMFHKTEAKTHILILKKGIENKEPNRIVKLLKLNGDGSQTMPVNVNEKKLIDRMDYTYHSGIMSSKGETIESLGIKIFRGKFSSLDLKASNVPYLHTTTLKDYSDKEIYLQNFCRKKEIKHARKGDVIIARVGKRIVGNWKIVRKGSIIISDCILVLRAPLESQNRLYRYFKSESYLNDINLLKHGVCSQIISKADLLKLKIPL